MDPPTEPPHHPPPPVPSIDVYEQQFRTSYSDSVQRDSEQPPTPEEARFNALLGSSRTAPFEMHSLPSPDEVRNSVFMSSGGGGNPYSGRTKRLLALVAICTVALSAIVGFSVGIAAGNKDSSASYTGIENPLGDSPSNTVSNGEDEDQIDSIIPPENENLSGDTADVGNTKTAEVDGKDDEFAGFSDKSRYEQVAGYLAVNEITTAAVLSDPDSPQHQAAKWMADYDPKHELIPRPDEDDFEFEQRYILVTMYFALDGDNWDLSLKFLSQFPTCDWSFDFNVANEDGELKEWDVGVTCNEDEKVQAIFITGNGLKGSLPEEIGYLESLEHLSLYNNSLSGELPETMRLLTALEFVAVEENNLDGNVPEWINEWTELEYLALGSNWFDGPIPSLESLTKLKELAMEDNVLTGGLEGLIDCAALESVYLNQNDLDGRVHSTTLKNAENLTVLDLSDNMLTGYFPEHFYYIKTLDLHHNKLSQDLPEIPEPGLPMVFLSLHRNSFTGDVPATIGLLSQLRHLDLSHNTFTGDVFDSLNGLVNLRYLHLAHNPLLKGGIPVMASLENLLELSMGSTNRDGDIPTGLGYLENLHLLDLSHNELTGEIPSELGNLPHLGFLMLNGNYLEGEIPPELANAPLVLFFADHNWLTGSVEEICRAEEEADMPASIILDCVVDCPCCDEETCCEEDDPYCNSAEIMVSFRTGFVRTEYVFSENLVFHFGA